MHRSIRTFTNKHIVVSANDIENFVESRLKYFEIRTDGESEIIKKRAEYWSMVGKQSKVSSTDSTTNYKNK